VELAVRNVEGETVKKLNVDDQVFGLKPHRAVVHQTMLAQLANRRAGSAHTKTRSEVKGSTAKLRRQKGSGRARMGSMSSPHLRGGAVAFGPRHRSFAQRLPNRMRRLALRSLLSAKAAEGSISVLDGLKMETPRTKEMLSVLQNLGLERSTLIVTAEPDRTVLVSSRNLPATKVLPAAYLNVLDLLACRNLLMTVDAVRKVEELWGGERAGSRRRKARIVEQMPAPAGAVPESPAEAKKPARAAVEAVEEPVTAEAAPKPRRRSRAASERAAKPEEPAPAAARRRRQPSAKATKTVKARAKKAPETQEAAPAEDAGEE
jgi:large subunit ribosomal protein L4